MGQREKSGRLETTEEQDPIAIYKIGEEWLRLIWYAFRHTTAPQHIEGQVMTFRPEAFGAPDQCRIARRVVRINTERQPDRSPLMKA